jgi:hypothetical protein
MTEVAGEYGKLYENRPPLDVTSPAPSSSSASSSSADDNPISDMDVDELFMSLMSDAEKVNRLAKMTGTVRYAIEGKDAALLAETVTEMERVAKHLAFRYRVNELIAAASDPAPDSGRLAELLLKRCYKLASEEYDALKAIDAEIDAFKKEP